MIVNSPSYAKSQARGLEKRLENATIKLKALTPQRGPGKRQITEEKALEDAIGGILWQHKVEGLLCCQYAKVTDRQTDLRRLLREFVIRSSVSIIISIG